MIVTICPGGFLGQVGFFSRWVPPWAFDCAAECHRSWLPTCPTLSLVARAVLDLFFCLAAIELAEMLVSRWGTVPSMPWLASAQCHG